MELEAELRAAVEHDERMGLKGAWLRNIKTILDTIATLRSDNERLKRERDEARYLENSKEQANKRLGIILDAVNTRAQAAEAERDTLLAQVGRLREIISRYGNRMRMSYAPAHLQQDIDDAFTAETRAALTKEPS